VSAERPIHQRLLLRLAGLLARPLVALLYSTVRIVDDGLTRKLLNRRPQPPGVHAFWHSHQLSALWHYRRTRAGVLVSLSRDGEYIARIAAAVGFRPVRGSSSRAGHAGLKELVRLARSGVPVAVTPDGPRGPRHTVGPGLLLLAQKTGYPIVPVAIGLSRFWELPSWDRFRIPKPFAKGYGCWGEPFHVPADADPQTLAALADEFRARMIALEQHADRCAARM